MATTPASASLKYWPGSHSGQARQGVYNGQNYSGTMTFNFSAIGDLTNIDITSIKLSFHVGALGGAYNKYLYLRYVPSGASSVSVDKYSLSGCYDTNKSLTFSASTHANGFTKLKKHIESITGTSNVVLGINNTGSSRGTASGKSYDYDYMSITSATLELTYTYKKSTGSIAEAQTGSNAKLKITRFDNSYTHKLTWKLNSASKTFKLYQGTAITGTSTTPAVYATGIASAAVDDQYINNSTNNIYVCTTAGNASTAKWKYSTNIGAFGSVWTFQHSAIPNSTKGTATVTIETLNSSGTLLGSNTYSFDVKVPDDIKPSIGSFTATPSNSGASTTAAGWGLYIQNKTKAVLTMGSVSAGTGASISAYSITSSFGNASASSMTSNLLTASGDVKFTAKVTDSRGRTGTKDVTVKVQAYAAPVFTTTPKIVRCTQNGTQDDIEGTYAKATVSWSFSSVNSKNSISVKRITVNGANTPLTNPGADVIVGGGNLLVDNSYTATITLTDVVGSTTTYTLTVPSAAYIIHIRKGGKSMGIGKAAPDTQNKLDIKWPTAMDGTLLVKNEIQAKPATGRGYIRIIPATDTQADLEFGRNGAHTWALSSRESASAFFGLYNWSRGTWPIKVAEATDIVTLSQPLSIASGGTGQTTPAAAFGALSVPTTNASWQNAPAGISFYRYEGSGGATTYSLPYDSVFVIVYKYSNNRGIATAYRWSRSDTNNAGMVWMNTCHDGWRGWIQVSNSYSSSDQAIGIWHDGKKLYRYVNSYSSASKGDVSLGTLPRTPYEVISIHGAYYDPGDTTWRSLPWATYGGIDRTVSVYVNGTDIKCFVGSALGSTTRKYRVIIEYTVE